MTLSEAARKALPAHTAQSWDAIADVVPAAAYLIGGTGLAVHLGHRPSHDLDFCLDARVDLGRLQSDLDSKGSMVVEQLTDSPLQTLNLYFLARGSNQRPTKIQFLDATRCFIVDTFTSVAGTRVAGIGDLMATKLAAIMGRAALRDYFDLMAIETQAHRYVEEGMALYTARYRPQDPGQSTRLILDALTSFDDVEADPALVSLATGRTVGTSELRDYWQRRTVEIGRHLERDGIG